MKNNSQASASLKRHNEPSGKYDFLKYGNFFALFSLFCIAVSIGKVAVSGLNYGIDFKGGTEIQVQFKDQVDPAKLRAVLTEQGFGNAQVQALGETNEFLLRLDPVLDSSSKTSNGETLAQIVEQIIGSLKQAFAGNELTVRRVDAVGPVVGSELKRNSVLALLYSLIFILIYVGMRFDYKYAPGAVFCLFHDAILTVGVLAFLGMEVSVQTLAAVLTVIGYSLNDTIVIFDRIRENAHLYRDKSFTWVCNKAINDCLSRTLLTTGLTLMSVIPMYFIAGGVIKEFSLALGIGMIFGVYSTMYIATPLVVLFDRLEHAHKAKTTAVA